MFVSTRGRPIRTFAAVTTCHAAGYAEHGRRMVETFGQHWPSEVPLLLYAEGFVPDAAPCLQVHDLLADCPELVAFKARHADKPLAHGKTRRFRPKLALKAKPPWIKIKGRNWGDGYRWNAVRFAHKVYAILHAARHVDTDVLIWIDADTAFFADVDLARLERYMPPDRMVGFLERPRNTHTECGFVSYNLRHPGVQRFLDEFEAMYTQDELFDEYEFHDSFLFDVVRRRAEARGDLGYDISEGIGQRASHVLINSSLGEFMDHMKGNRKEVGTSRAEDLVVARDEDYWKRMKRPDQP